MLQIGVSLRERNEEGWRIANTVAMRGHCLGMMDALAMNDAHIRAATKRALFLEHRGDGGTVIFEELGIQHGLSRIDLAVVNGELHGFELKSDQDTLARLSEQADSYGRVFDRVTLVVGERHLRHAVEVVPDWWGIRVARVESGTLHFSDLKIAISNPSLDPISIATLLWRDEALLFLEESGGGMGMRSKCRAEIYSKLVEEVDLNNLRGRVRQCLRERSNWRSAGTRLSCDG
jgi:hypothetical protein